MRKRKLVLAAGVVALLAWPGTMKVVAQYNPNGFIQNRGWDILMPLVNPGGATGGGADTMLSNWVPPVDLTDVTFAPVAGQAHDGTALPEIDFDASPASGYDLGGLSPNPIWVNAAFLEAAFADAGFTWPADDTVWYDTSSGVPGGVDCTATPEDPHCLCGVGDGNGLVELINRDIVGSGAVPGSTCLPRDNIMEIAITYVENTSGAPLLVNFCAGSDDSLQIILNNVTIWNHSIPRGVGTCSDNVMAVLPTGISKITCLVWEGGGGNGLRLQLQDDTGAAFTDADVSRLKVLGPNDGTYTGQDQYGMARARTGTDPLSCEGSEKAEITITGNGAGDPADAVTVVETISGDVVVSDVSNGGTVEEIIASDDGIHLETGAALEFFVLGPIANAGGADPGYDAMREDYLSIADADVETLNEGDTVNDRDAVEQTVRRVAVNDGDALNFNAIGGDGDNIMHYAWTKLTLTEPTGVIVGVNSDDAVQVLVNGAELVIHSGGQGYGGFGSMEWSGLASLPAGTHTVVTKVFEGGGGHGVRLLFYKLPAGGIGTGGLDCATAPNIAPGETGVGSTPGGDIGIECTPESSPAHYFAVEGTGARMRAELCNPVFLFDTAIALFHETCDAAGCLAQNDDDCGRQSAIEWDSIEGDTYYIRVYGWSDRQGVYFLRVSDTNTAAEEPLIATLLTGAGVCASPDGVCDTEAETVVGKTITWDVTRGDVDAGLGYTLEASATQTVAMSGEIAGDTIATGLTSVDLTLVPHTGPIGIFDNSRDIGAPPTEGLTTFDGSAYTVFGSGQDIWNGGDDFQFAYKLVTGDFVATAHVVSRDTVAGGNSWGRHGIHARYNCTRGAKFSMAHTLFPTDTGEQNQPQHQFRLFNNDNGNNRDYYRAADGTFPTEGRLPTWMRLVRQGNVMYTYMSEDAGGEPANWCLIGSDSYTGIPDDLLVGLANQGRDPVGATAVFDNVSIEPLETPEDMVFEKSDTLIGLGYDQDDGTPENGRIAVGGGGFTPAVVAGKLRLTQEDIGGSATAVWYDVPGSEALTAEGMFAEFDVFMTRTLQDPPENSNPADGMTFAVMQGTADDLLGACVSSTAPVITELTQNVFIGDDVGGGSETIDNGDGTYTSISTSGHDIWDGGDDFEFQYEEITGDFQIAVEMISYDHSTGAGRWGKFGLMAREVLDRCGRYTMSQAHGPDAQDDARQAGRTQFNPGCGAMYEDVYGGASNFPQFLRLTRRGNVLRGWASNEAGLADGTLDPCNDCNWTYSGRNDDWGDAAPETLFVGFANSEHESEGAETQTITFRMITECLPDAGFLRTTGLVGGAGGALGYEAGSVRANTTCHPSLAVEMDDWVGGGEPGNEPGDGGAPDFDYNWHIGLDLNASVSSTQTNVDFGVATGDLPDIFSADGVHVEMFYAPTGQVDVYAAANDGSVPRTQVLSTKIQPLSGPVVVGFTGGTGGATTTMEVDNLVVGKAVVAPPGGIQKPSDTNQDGKLDISDPVGLLNHLFLGTLPVLPCGDGTVNDPANIVLLDSNGDGGIDLSDAVFTLGFLFLGGDAPASCVDISCPCIRIPDCPDNSGVGDCP